LLEFGPLCINAKSLTALDVPLALSINRLTKLPTSPPPNQNFGSKLAQFPQLWRNLPSIEDMWFAWPIRADCLP